LTKMSTRRATRFLGILGLLVLGRALPMVWSHDAITDNDKIAGSTWDGVCSSPESPPNVVDPVSAHPGKGPLSPQQDTTPSIDCTGWA
jgi:hypothetical protein